MKDRLLILWFIGFFLTPHLGMGQVVINEFNAKNLSIITDFNGDLPDWVEIYNGYPTAYDLSGHYLSDNFTDPYKWQFPDTILEPNTRILVFASSKDTLANAPHTNFKLSSNGEEIIFSHADGSTIDSIDYGPTEPNFSLGRLSDGSDTWACFSIPTPNASNILSDGLVECYIEAPEFSLESGFYDNGVQLTILSNSGDSIFYTLDGSTPTTQSYPYQNPIQVDTSTVIRAISYNSSTKYYSLPESHTYIIDEGLENIPVISICTDPCNLWSDEKGIYILGPNADTIFPFWGANYWNGWEVPIELEFFDEDHNLAFEGRFDMKAHGGKGARTRDMRPLRIMAKNKYGMPFIQHQVFPRKDADTFKRLVLRNSGSDFNQTYFRDGIVHDLALKTGLNIDVSGYRPSIVFLNGEYWGLHNIREKVDEYYLYSNHGVDISNVDLLEENDQITVGNFDLFDMHEEYILNHDLNQQEYFDVASQWFDLESMSDYFITQTFHNNYDWPNNNLKFWRERKDGAQWRYIMFDLDYGLNPLQPGEVEIKLLSFTLDYYKDTSRHVRILLRFLENDEFRRYFINRYADLVNTIFSTDFYMEHLTETKERIEPHVPRHFNKWNTPVNDWYYHINEHIEPFLELRPDIIREDIQNTFGLEDQIDLRFEVFPPATGDIQINTIPKSSLGFPWNGIYYKNLPIDLVAHPDPFHTFLHWEDEDGNILASNAILKGAFNDDSTIKAIFQAKEGISGLNIIPNPAHQHFTVNILVHEEAETQLSIVTPLGQTLVTRNLGTLSQGAHSFPVDFIDLPEGVYYVQVIQGGFKEVEAVRVW